jgi:hypothetical protein
MKNGKLKLRNSVSASEEILNAIKAKYKENVIWYPSGNEELTSENLDVFRNMKAFEAVESALSDKPELFSKLPDKSKRIQPWTAVRFFVANQSDDINPCNIIIGRWEGIIDISWGWSILTINTDKWTVDTPEDGTFEYPVEYWNEVPNNFAILYGYDNGIENGTPYQKFAWKFVEDEERPAIKLFIYEQKETVEDAILLIDDNCIIQESYLQWVGD